MRRAALHMLAVRSAERSTSAMIRSAATTWRRSAATGDCRASTRVAVLLELERRGVELVVGEDQVLGTLEILAEQDLGARGMFSVTCAASLAISVRISSSSWWNRESRGRPASPGVLTDSVRGDASTASLAHPNRARSTYCSVRSSSGLEKIFSVGSNSTSRPVRRSLSGLISVMKNAVRSLTRAACCMLWVTMTIVYFVLISCISSSMRAVAIGSSAEHGSSIRITSGLTAIARAMHSRCCWPPDRPRAERVEAVLDLVPERGAAQRPLDDVVELAASS